MSRVNGRWPCESMRVRTNALPESIRDEIWGNGFNALQGFSSLLVQQFLSKGESLQKLSLGISQNGNSG